MKAPPQALEGPEEPSWHFIPFHSIYGSLLSNPLHAGPGEEALKVFLFGALCYTICTMKAPPQALEGPREEPSWNLQKPPLQALPGPGEEASWGLFGALCYTICTMKAPPQALEGPGEEPSWRFS